MSVQSFETLRAQRYYKFCIPANEDQTMKTNKIQRATKTGLQILYKRKKTRCSNLIEQRVFYYRMMLYYYSQRT